MPPLSRYLIRAGMIYLVIVFLLAALTAARFVFDLPPWISAFQPVYTHLLVVGWITQLIFGVAYWMFPKNTRTQPRGSERLGWVMFFTLNTGLLLRVIGEPWNATEPGSIAGHLLVISALLQWVAVWGFVLNTWTRVKER